MSVFILAMGFKTRTISFITDKAAINLWLHPYLPFSHLPQHKKFRFILCCLLDGLVYGNSYPTRREDFRRLSYQVVE